MKFLSSGKRCDAFLPHLCMSGGSLEDDDAPDSSDALDRMTGTSPFLRLLVDDAAYKEPPREEQLGGGAVAGIVVSIVAVLAALVWGFVRHRRDNMLSTQAPNVQPAQ